MQGYMKEVRGYYLELPFELVYTPKALERGYHPPGHSAEGLSGQRSSDIYAAQYAGGQKNWLVSILLFL